MKTSCNSRNSFLKFLKLFPKVLPNFPLKFSVLFPEVRGLSPDSLHNSQNFLNLLQFWEFLLLLWHFKVVLCILQEISAGAPRKILQLFRISLAEGHAIYLNYMELFWFFQKIREVHNLFLFASFVTGHY